MNIIEQLNQLGLNGRQARVYLDFFSEVPLQKQNEMEKTCSPTAWYGL